MALSDQHKFADSVPWLIAPIFFLGGVAMTFLAVPITLILGLALILGLPVLWNDRWIPNRRTKRPLDHAPPTGAVLRSES